MNESVPRLLAVETDFDSFRQLYVPRHLTRESSLRLNRLRKLDLR